MNAQLLKTLKRYANSDLKLAVKQGATSICQTKYGRVDVAYLGDDNFSLSAEDVDKMYSVFFTGSKVQTVNYIANYVYNVVEG